MKVLTLCTGAASLQCSLCQAHSLDPRFLIVVVLNLRAPKSFHLHRLYLLIIIILKINTENIYSNLLKIISFYLWIQQHSYLRSRYVFQEKQNEKSGIVLKFCKWVLNIWLNRRLLDSHMWFFIQSVVLVEVYEKSLTFHRNLAEKGKSTWIAFSGILPWKYFNI